MAIMRLIKTKTKSSPKLKFSHSSFNRDGIMINPLFLGS